MPLNSRTTKIVNIIHDVIEPHLKEGVDADLITGLVFEDLKPLVLEIMQSSKGIGYDTCRNSITISVPENPFTLGGGDQ